MRRLSNEESAQVDGEVRVNSTSNKSASVNPIQLRPVTDTTRLTFVPTLVTNLKAPENSVKGKLIYERKGKNDEQFPSDAAAGDFSERTSKKSITSNNWLELDLSSGEIRKLFETIQSMYKLFDSMEGMPSGPTAYVEVDRTCQTLLAMLEKDRSSTRLLASSDIFDLVRELIQLISRGASQEGIRKALEGLDESSINTLSSSLRLNELNNAKVLIEQNLDNDKEEFWQKEVFGQHSWIISQLFSTPCVVFAEKAYVGGKTIENKHGNICDFLYQNSLTHNISLIEIKTPCTPILGNEYRQSYSLASEMSGAVNQVLNYKDSLLKSYGELTRESSGEYRVFSPQCAVIIGKASEFGGNERKISAFESYRHALNEVTVITYDEILERIISLIDILKLPQPSAQEIESDTDNWISDSTEEGGYFSF